MEPWIDEPAVDTAATSFDAVLILKGVSSAFPPPPTPLPPPPPRPNNAVMFMKFMPAP